jgi:Copper amine oxidase N-terminal domain
MKKKETWYKKLTFSFLAATVVLASPAYTAAEGMKDFVAQKDNGKGKGLNEDDNSDDDTDDPEEDEEEDDDTGNGKGRDNGKGKDKESKGAEKQLEQISERLDDIEERISEATGKLDSILGGQTPSEEEPPTEEVPSVEGEEPPAETPVEGDTEEPVDEEIPSTEEVAAQNTDTETETDEDTAEDSTEDVTEDVTEEEETDEDSDDEEQSEEDAEEEEELDEEEKYESANGVRGKLISSINQLSAVEKQISGLESKTDNADEITALNERAAFLKTMAQEQLDRIETAKPEKTDKEESKKEKKTKVYVDDVEVEFDQEPVVIANRTVVPLRAIFEALGAEITWDNKTQTVTATKDGVTITLKIGEKSATKNGETVELDQEAIALNGRTMVPVRFIGESFDTEVVWDQETGGIYVVE